MNTKLSDAQLEILSCKLPRHGAPQAQPNEPLFLPPRFINFKRPENAKILSKEGQKGFFGDFESLAVEIIYLIVEELDFESASNLAYTCSTAMNIVYSVPIFNSLKTTAHEAMIALIRTKVSIWYPMKELFQVLKSENCHGCKKFGPYLFLPASQRCCYSCLITTDTYRVVPADELELFFGIEKSEIDKLPVMLGIPGLYFGISPVELKEPKRLISVQHAFTLAQKRLDSDENVGIFIDQAKADGNPLYNRYRWLRMYFETENFYPELEEDDRDYEALEYDPYVGMGAVKFPFMSQESDIEDGLYCNGCRLVHIAHIKQSNWRRHAISPDIGNQVYHDRIVFASQQSYSKAELLVHIYICPAAKRLAKDAGIDLESILEQGRMIFESRVKDGTIGMNKNDLPTYSALLNRLGNLAEYAKSLPKDGPPIQVPGLRDLQSPLTYEQLPIEAFEGLGLEHQMTVRFQMFGQMIETNM